MRGTRRLLGTLAVTCGVVGGAASGAAQAAEADEPSVSRVELVAPAEVPQTLIRLAIGDLAGRPRSRRAIRDSLERLWTLGLFAGLRVEEVDEPAGLVLRFYLTPRPFVRRIAWRGVAGLDQGQLAAAAALALGEEASPERLARARDDLLLLYRREGFLDARVEVEATAPDEGPARDVTVSLDAGAPAQLALVKIAGSLGLSPDAVAKGLALRQGDRYREPVVRDRVRALETRLRRDGFLEARVATQAPVRQAGTPNVELAVDVAAGPRYAVVFDGRQALAESVLRDRLTFLDSGVVDEFEVEASARQIEAAYRDAGYAFAQVTGALDRATAPPTVRFDVTEGPEVRVASVTFHGEVALAPERLRAAIATRPPGLVDRGLFRQDLLDRDVAALLALARGEGFADAVVGPAEVRFEDGRSRAHVEIPIVEGARIRIGSVAVAGESALTAGELLAAIPLRAGDPWDPLRVDEGRRSVERLYARHGYHGATVEAETHRGDHQVEIAYRVTEGPQMRVGRVLVRGLFLTMEDTVRRQLRVAPGDVFDPDRLDATRRRLERAPAFATVDVGPPRPAPAPFADVEVTLAEQKPWRFELGVGYDTAEGARGYLELGHDNLFGTARSAAVRFKGAIGGDAVKSLERADLVYREPWIGSTAWEGQVQLYGERSENLGYDLERLGLVAWVGDDLLNPRGTRAFRSQLRYRLEVARLSHVSPDLVAEGIEAGTQRIGSLTPAVAWDLRDDRVNPRRGSIHRAALEVADSVFGGDVEFVKAEFSTSWFFSWLPPTVFALSGRLGLATAFGGTSSLPIEDRFFAGGSTSVRGFPENRLGPRDAAGNPVGGEALVVLSAEWRFPIWRWLGGAVFIDAGTVTPTVGDLSLGAFKSGAGAGLRVTTPVGPIRLDVAYALQPISGEDRLQVYVTVGFPF
jgi:outer membrane protein insertion porin family